jgi:hypothetical protein
MDETQTAFIRGITVGFFIALWFFEFFGRLK